MTNSDTGGGPRTLPRLVGQEQTSRTVTDARADAGTQHGKKPVSITLPWPAKALHSNARGHWSVKAKATKQARLDAWASASSLPCWPTATILIEYYPPTRRGDPQNVPSSLKAYIDGIADAMGCDDRGFKVDFPTVFAGTKKGGEVVFRVFER